MTEGYFHVRIIKKNGKEEYEIDLTESELLEKIVNPIKRKSDFLCGHALVNRSEIERMKIVHTLEHSSEMKGVKFQSGMERWVGGGDRIRPFAYFVVRKGKDVTKKYLDFLPLPTEDTPDTDNSRNNSRNYELFPRKNYQIDDKLCFVLMSFDEQYRSVYDMVIKSVAESLGLEAKRADDILKPESIMQGVWEHINKARIIIADLSGRYPNVFYEVGLSHALRKNVIFIARSIDDVPFDIKHIRCIIYQESIGGGKKLESELRSMIKEALNNV